MERLTDVNWRNLDPWECCGQDHYCQRGCHDEGGCTKGCIVPKVYARLAAYEDTGLEPEEIKMALDGAVREFMGYDDLGSITHLRDLAQAEKDGRLVVLPCKVGDTVWMIVDKRSKIYKPEFSFVKKSRLTWNNMRRILEAFGKTVFLTRTEAEAALERRKGEQNE